MWKKYLIIAIVIFISLVVGGKKKKSDSNDCLRTNKEAFRYCTKSCSSDSDCNSNQKCLCDEDCGMSCVRNKLRCETLSKSKNSRQKSSNGRAFNSVVTYTCKPPFELRGSSTRTCRATGKWDGKKARCRIECKDPGEISSGNRRVEGLQAGKHIQYWCFDSYNLIGSVRIKCLETGEWSAPKPKCELPQCNPPKIPDSAIVYYPRRMKKRFKYSDRVLLKCKDGYFKSRGGVLSCQGSKQWTGDIICSPKSCGRPRDVSNGKIIGYLYSFKEKVRYVCNEGYKLKGPPYRICQANEEWGGGEPTCEVVDCGALDKPDHGDIIEQVGLTFGNRIVFECKDEGYELSGSRIRTCQSDGTWSGSLTTCDIVQCGDPGKPVNGAQNVNKGFVYGGSVKFTCDKDYTLSGTPTIYCQENKRWTASVPQCLAPCPDPGRPYQGNRFGVDFRHGKSVTFRCPKDYRMDGVRTITCSDGRWSNTKPSCKAPCAKLAPPSHGRISGEGFTDGVSVMFSCRHGYTKVGPSPITCNDGNWNKPPPVCKGFCPKPRTPYKVRLLESKTRYLDGEEATFYCDSNYDLFGNNRIRCVGKNWGSSVTVCKARCRFSRTAKGGVYLEGRSEKSGMIKHGENLTYACLPAYTMIGSKTRECDNGRWTNDAPVCKAPCLPPGGIAHGKKDGTDYGHDKTVWYQCDAEYTLKGSNRLICKDGTWNSDPPECKAPCSNPKTPLNGSMQVNDLRHDSWVTFTCDQNYQLDGNKNIRCNDGSWSGSVPHCVAACPDPGVPSNGRRLDKNFQEGDTVTFECNTDHDLVGNDTIRCEGGMWSSEVPKCRARCTFDGSPVNGYTTDGNFRMQELLPDGSNVKYACDVSYTLVGSDVRQCDDGSWNTSLPSCKASCDYPGLLAEGRKIGNEYSHGHIVRYECTRKGYSLVGNPTLTCNDGSWDSERPKCQARCNDPGIPSNGTKDGDDFRSRANVTFRCNPPFELIGSRVISCQDGKWSASRPTCSNCARPLGLEENKNRIRSPSSVTDPLYPPNAARLNDPSAWCPSRTPAYLQIDLDKSYKITAIATQGGTARNKWVQRYTISFRVGKEILYYTESSSRKDIPGNKDASSLVKYNFKEPFITSVVRIYPSSSSNDPICLRVELYGCDPNPDCILVGSMFWGFWKYNDDANNYYKAYVTKLNSTHLDFALEIGTNYRRSYRRNDPVLILDTVPEMKDISINSSVIARQHPTKEPHRYRSGIVVGFPSASLVSVEFDDGETLSVFLKYLRLMNRPGFCVNDI